MKECEQQFMSNLITSYQAQAITFELTRWKADAFSRVVDTLAGVPVDLNPHQIDAAVFALNSPFSKGGMWSCSINEKRYPTLEAGIHTVFKSSSRKVRNQGKSDNSNSGITMAPWLEIKRTLVLSPMVFD
ncbi:MAG: hypothetical protein PHQ75_11100 [Thermoguttaceae bacterium]|nr:hypothetical protein [Thermoguttaceae bacterium]